jgi:hypothetical protein
MLYAGMSETAPDLPPAEGQIGTCDPDSDWRRAAKVGVTNGLLRHLPAAIGIVVRGGALCLVGEGLNMLFGAAHLESLLKLVGL